MASSLPKTGYPLISVITPTFNQAQFIEQTIESVLRQNYKNFEHIVLDGGSTDGTIEILKRYPHLRWVSEKDHGQSDALNKGLRMARGEIIAWLNSDDYYASGAFHMIARTFETFPMEKVLVGDCTSFIHGSSKFNRHANRPLEFEDLIRYWDGWNPPTQPSIFFKAELIKEFGDFDVSLHRAMDYDFWLRISQKFRFIYIPEVLSFYRLHPDSKSGIGTDWSSFYSEWHHVYLRYKSRSRILPQGTMVTVAIPLNAPYQANVGTVRDFIMRLQGQRFRDMEILIVSDMDSSTNPLNISNSQIPIRIVTIPKFTRAAFNDAVRENAHSFALHCPKPEDVVPDQWYAQALDLLLDNPELKSVSDVSLTFPANSPRAEDRWPAPFELWRLDAFRPSRYKISVIIPTCNRSDVLKACMDALSRQSLDPDMFEVIITDDGSTDATKSTVQDFDAPYSLIYLYQENRGPGTARNAAIRQSRGEYLLILNDDAVPANDLLERHLEAHARLGNVKASVLGSFPFRKENLDTAFMTLMQNSPFAFQYAGMISRKLYDWRYFWTCNISLLRSALDQTGLFDESFRDPAGEDTELGYRLWKQGYQVYYDPSCKAEHAHTLKLKRFCQRQVTVGRNEILLSLKHPSLCRQLTGYASVQDAGEQAIRWLASNEKRVLKSIQFLSEAEQKKVDLSPNAKFTLSAEFKRMEQEFAIINKYWIYQGFIQGLARYCQSGTTDTPQNRKDNQLRITFVVPGTALSGGTKVVFEYCNRLAERGHVITLVSLTAEKPKWFQFNAGVQYVHSGWDDRRLSFDLPEGDFVFATQYATAYHVARLPSSKGMKLYFIQSYESATITTTELGDPTYMLPLHKIAVSSWLAEEIQQRFGDRPAAIPNGIDLEQFFPDAETRRKYPEHDFRIGILFHSEPRKGFSVGLESFRLIQNKCPEAKLIVFGTNRPAEPTGNEFHECMTEEQVRIFYNSLDVFVSTSQQEGFGLTGLEAQACGVPLVTTDSGGSREYAIHEQTALVCPPGDSQSIAEAVLRLRKDAELRKKMSRAGLAKAKEFEWSRSVLRMEDFLLRNLKESGPSFKESAEPSPKVYPMKAGKFYSRPSSAPVLLRLLWKTRDKLQGWRLRYSYVLTRRFR